MRPGELLPLEGRDSGRILALDPEFVLLRDEAARELILVPRPDTPRHSGTAALRLRAHLELGRSLAVPGVARPLRIEPAGPRLVLEDVPGEPLSGCLSEERRLPLPRACALGLAMTRVVAGLHQAGITHRGLRPDAFLAAGDTVTLVDLGSASRARRGDSSAASGLPRTDLLPWLAPELTGRMSLGYDTRADLYALGTLLYALFTGRPPFVEADPAALLHRHFAVRPTPMASLRPDVPPALEGVVQKLLAKRPDDRYFTARGVALDLERALRALEAGEAPAFEPGAGDRADWLRRPARLYGRERDFEAMQAVYEQTAQGATAVLLLQGPSGIGKSLLARELRRVSNTRHGAFAQGKFNQDRSTGDALLAALRELCLQALAESDMEVAELTEKARHLGAGAAVVAEALPEARTLLGNPGAPDLVPETEGRNRFRLAMRAFAGLFARPGRPLVLCLDDVQWADPAALGLLEWFLQPGGLSHTLVLLTSRDGAEFSSRVEDTLTTVAEGGVAVDRVALSALDVASSTTLLEDATGASRASLEPLAALLVERTRGNPLTFVETLVALHEDGVLRFDHAEGVWRWDLDEVRRRTVDEGLARVLGARVERLPPEARAVLHAGACLGSRGTLALLAAATGLSETDADPALAAAEEAGLLLRPLDRSTWAFVHDQVRKAVLDDLGDGRSALQAALARRLGDVEGDAAVGSEDVARQAIGGTVVLLSDPWERRLALARALQRAGRQWRRTMAFDAVSDALGAATQLLGDEGWERVSEETLEAHHGHGEALAFSGSKERAEAVFAMCLERAPRPLDKARIHKTRVVLANLAGEHNAALLAGQAGLALLGEDFPLDAGKGRGALEIARSKWLLGRKRPEDLLSARELTDPRLLLAQDLYMELNLPAYSRSEDLVGFVYLRMANLTFKHGMSPQGAYSLVIYGVVVNSGLKDAALGYAFGRVGMRLAEERYPTPFWLARIKFTFQTLLTHWQEDWVKNRALLEVIMENAEAAGDFQYITYTQAQFASLGVLEGRPLGAFAAMLREDEVAARRGRFHNTSFYQSSTLRRIDHLTGNTLRRGSWSTEQETEESYLARLDKSDFTPVSAYADALRIGDHVLAGEPARAVELALKVEGRAHALLGQLMSIELEFVRGVAAGDLLAREPEDKRARKMLQAAIKRFAYWVKLVPGSFGGRLRLLEGLAARVAGEPVLARGKLNLALESARRRGELHVQGMVLERLGELSLAQGNAVEARRHFTEAMTAYGAWGATAKVRWLREDHAAVLGLTPSGEGATGVRPDALDLASVLKAAAALSSEIRLDRLLERIMTILVENVGARRGALLRERGGELRVEVVAEPDRSPRSLGGVAISDAPALAEAVVRYVARTGEAIVLDDASRDSRFAQDAHLERNPGVSVLCRSLLSQGRLACVVYLENDLADGAFSPDRLRVVELLSAQAAIALENAALYGEVEGLARSFERFVPKEFISSLGRASVARVELGDSVQKEMTVLFSDMRGFSALVEGQTPEQNIAFINEYLGAMEPAILGHGGFVDSYLGDAIMALFDGDPADAITAGVEMFTRLGAYNAQRASRGLGAVRIGVGLNAGLLTLGTIGGPQRIKCGVIGDPVNLAARVESLTKSYQAPLLTTDTTLERAGGRFLAREVDRVRVVGRQTPVTLVEVFDADPAPLREKKQATLGSWREALERYHARDFAVAASLFAAVRAELPQDAVARLRHERCLGLLSVPPPGDWDGVATLEKK